MHHDNAAEQANDEDEVVAEFDQTNGKAQGLEGDSEFNEDLDPAVADDESGDHREPLMTTLVEDLADGGSEQERRD